jgi:hypothetical protein
VPPLPGTDLGGVFVFRTLDDCQAIGAHAADCYRAAPPAAACIRWRRSACKGAGPASTARWSMPPTSSSRAAPGRPRRRHGPDLRRALR